MSAIQFIADRETLRDKFASAYRAASNLVSEDHGVIVTVDQFEDLRTLDQNKKLWPMLADISKQVPWVLNGKESNLKPEQWKDIFTAALTQETNIAPGINGGFVMLGTRTSRMKKKAFCELIELIYAFGADKGVTWSDPAEVDRLRAEVAA
jgi:hypothetical protein